MATRPRLQTAASQPIASGWAAWLLALAVIIGVCSNANAITISADREAYQLGTVVRILEDTGRIYDIEQIISGALEHAFEPSTSPMPNFGLTGSRYWVEIPLTGDARLTAGERLWYLEVGSPQISSVTLYDPQGGGYVAAETGRGAPYLQRPLPSRHFVFPIVLEPAEEKKLYLRLESNAPVQLPLRLVSPKTYLASNDMRQLGWGLYFGALLIMLLYNSLVFAALRERVYLYYVLNIGCLALAHATIEGYSYTYLWPADSWWNLVSVPVLVSLTIYFASQFLRSFLDTPTYAPESWDRIMTTFGALALISTAGALLLPPDISLRLAMSLALLAAPTALICGLVMLRRGNRSARLFILAWLALLTGATCFWLTLFGVLPANAFTMNALQYGVAAEAALLSVALASRVSAARQAQMRADQQREAAEAAAEAKSNFLTNMTHEMRTPITAIQGFTDLALAANPTGRQSELLKAVKTASEDLLTIVNQMLDLSRLNAGMLRLEPSDFELDDLLEETGALFMAELSRKNVEMALMRKPGVPNRIHADRFRLKQILVNLLANAVKFTHLGEIELQVELSSESAAGMVLLFSVRDTGIGIETASADRLFEPFTQADESDGRQYTGTGLGLAICKGLIERMNGSVWFRSQPGSGTHFLFTIAIGHAMEANEPAPPGTVSGLRIAVLGNRPLFRHFVSTVLARECKELLVVEDASQLPDDLQDWILLVDRDEQEGDQLLAQLGSRPTHIVAAARGEGDVALSRLPPQIACTTFHKPLCRNVLLRALLSAAPLPPPYEPSRHLASPALRAAGRRVLVVEDSAVNRKLIALLLRNAGIEADLAEDGATALAMLEKGEYQYVLSDIRMPGITGYELAARIRAERRYDSIVLVALTANAMPEEEERCLAAGFHAFLTKPIDAGELYRVLGGGSARSVEPWPAVAELDAPAPYTAATPATEPEPAER